MIGWISSILAGLTMVVAFAHTVLKPDTSSFMGGNPMAVPAVLLLAALLAFVLGKKAPEWSAARHISDWSAMIAATFVVLFNVHQVPALLPGHAQPPAAEKKAAPPQPKEEAREPKQEEKKQIEPAATEPREEPEGDGPAPRIKDEDGEPTYDSEQEAREAPEPGGPVKVMVRDRDGNEYPYFLNPGEKLPSELEDLDALAKGAWTEISANKRGHFIVHAEINNTPVTAMIDTGASAVALSHRDAETIGISTFSLDYTLPVHTANGVVKAAPVTLRRIEVDGVVVRDVKAWVMPRGAMRGTLMGMSFLTRLSGFSVDNGKLTLKQ